MNIEGADPAIVAFVDQMDAHARDLYPEKSSEWRRAYLHRIFHFGLNDGDMTDAPPLPDEGSDVDA